MKARPAQIRAGLGKDFPQGWQFKPEISVKPAAAPVDATVCQQLFSELLGKGKIRFEPGAPTSIRIPPALLDRLIETALRCPTANIEIAGHTDADGEDASNQALSEKRAQAVVDYLVKAGLPADRFTAVGYGSTQPVAGNDTDEGKAQNRRIEFRGEVSDGLSVDVPSGAGCSARCCSGFAMGWIAVVQRGDGVSKVMARWLAVLVGGAGRGLVRARGPRPLRLLARPRPGPVRLLSCRLRGRLVAARLGGLAQPAGGRSVMLLCTLIIGIRPAAELSADRKTPSDARSPPFNRPAAPID